MYLKRILKISHFSKVHLSDIINCISLIPGPNFHLGRGYVIYLCFVKLLAPYFTPPGYQPIPSHPYTIHPNRLRRVLLFPERLVISLFWCRNLFKLEKLSKALEKMNNKKDNWKKKKNYCLNIFYHHQLFPLLAASILSFRKENLLRVNIEIS